MASSARNRQYSRSAGRQVMNRTSLLFIGTVSVALIEWLLFELLRTPYAPPRDMLTLLGQEKYQVVGFMWFLGAVWIAIAIWLLLTSRLTLRQYLSFTAMIALLLACFLFILRNPIRAVTPWDMMWM